MACSLASAAIVTTPAGTIVSTTPSPGVSDPFATGVWQRTEVRTGSSIGITGDYPRSGDGSVLMTSNDQFGKAVWQYVAATPLGALSSFSSATYDWYRASTSTAPQHAMPAFRILVDIDGQNVGTSTDIASIIFERVYQPGEGTTVPAPTDAWTTEAIGPNSIVWVYYTGQGSDYTYTPLSEYMDGSHGLPAGLPGVTTPITGNSQIIGINAGIGSGMSGTFRGAVDNMGLVAASTFGPDNFELTAPPPPPPAPVPTTDLWALLGLSGLLAGLAAWRQRRRHG